MSELPVSGTGSKSFPSCGTGRHRKIGRLHLHESDFGIPGTVTSPPVARIPLMGFVGVSELQAEGTMG